MGVAALANCAVTDLLLVIATSHVGPCPVQAPVHPTKVEPPEAFAVRVTLVSLEKDREQVAPQLIPDGMDVTVPLPVPFLLTLKVLVLGMGLGPVKFAVTISLRLSTKLHVEPCPLHTPSPQPEKKEEAEGAAVRVTVVC